MNEKTEDRRTRKTKKAIEAAYGHRSADEKEGMRKACESIISCIFAEEIYQAKSQDEINAILEVRGDFIVMKSEEGKRMYFSLWKEKEAVAPGSRYPSFMVTVTSLDPSSVICGVVYM